MTAKRTSPGFGAAFKISDKMVLGGGYGEYFWQMPLSQILQTSQTKPPLNLRFENIVNEFDNYGTHTLRTDLTSLFSAPNIVANTNGRSPCRPLPKKDSPGMGHNWQDGELRPGM